MSGAAPRDVPLQCRCGTVRAVAHGVTPQIGNRCVCYCDDCQAFIRFLGRTADVLDANGGTDVFQLSPARIEFTAGRERVACMRLTPKGLARWYASCCNTPIGNTMAAAGLPFVGLVCAFAPEPARDAFGPIRTRVFRKFATGDRAALPPDTQPQWRMLLRVLRLMLGWRLRGDHKRSPFFDAATGAPLVAARVLTTAEREALR
ncbi:MAG TPA: DUF6151 family protein [Gammaproteobacteria bacterium]|nr:DUF6151 family protein [Gammaproteobacteria bacterium]